MGTIDRTYVSGSRFYFDVDDPRTLLPGVTSVMDVIPKTFLQWWNAKMAAQRAVESLDFIEKMTRVNEESAVKYIASAAGDHSRARRKIGTMAHDVFERMVRGQETGHYHQSITNHVRFFGEFLDRVQPELLRAEDVAWSGTHGYAGSFDALLRVKLNDEGLPDPQGDPAVVVADWKTSKETYPDVALQMSAYANADLIIAPDGSSEPMIAVDGAMVLHVKEELWGFKPVVIDRPVFGMFLKCLDFFNALRGWDGEGKGRTRVRGVKESVIGQPIASGGRAVSGTERRS